MQALYGILAMTLIALLSLTVMRAQRATETRIFVNEVATQVTGVGVDILEAIGRMPFDEKTDTTKVFTFPAVTNPNQLTPQGSSEWGNKASFAACDDIDDFHGLTVVRNFDGFNYTVTITVRYVNLDTPEIAPGGQTYAKEVLLNISNPSLYVGSPDNPITVPVRRVFTYQRATSA
jgi:hypothetical protein